MPVGIQGVDDLAELLRGQVLQVAVEQAFQPVLGVAFPLSPAVLLLGRRPPGSGSASASRSTRATSWRAVPGSGGLRREVLIRMAGSKRIGGHEKQHHASTGNCRLPRALMTVREVVSVTDYSVLVCGRPVSCDAVYVTRVVHVPYVVEQDEDGAWCASTLLRPGVGAFGDGATPEEAITDLRAALETLVEVVGLRQV